MSVRDVVQAAAGALGGEALYAEDVFGTYLYTGTNTTNTITNNIDLSGEGGLVWTKSRSSVSSNALLDTERGGSATLVTNNNNASAGGDRLTFNSNGYTILSTAGTLWNGSGTTYASWTFRKAPKFFDVVTYTGNGTARTIAHNLGSVPGCIIIKSTSNAYDWAVYHRGTDSSSPQSYRLRLNATDARASDSSWNTTAPTSTEFSLGSLSEVNLDGATFVAYLFAHNDGGFGATGTEDVISCGSFTTDGSGVATVNLGWEPQWVLVKPISGSSNMDWRVMDNMRGITVDSGSAVLSPNLSSAEYTSGTFDYSINGFKSDGLVTSTECIYIAIRRPHKPPTAGTEVFSAVQYTSSSASGTEVTVNLAPDWVWLSRYQAVSGQRMFSRLTGGIKLLFPYNGNAESDQTGAGVDFDTSSTQIKDEYIYGNWGTSTPAFAYSLKRGAGFFDVVAYTGADSGTSFSHNLGVTPELVIFKSRNNSEAWMTFYNNSDYLWLNLTNAKATATNFLTRTSTSVTTNASSAPANYSGYTYLAFLFSSLEGVSKVGSYTGTAADLNVDCGFSAGARFVLIKRTDSTGNWYLYDSVRGIVAGNDPYLFLNGTAAEVTNTDYIDPLSAGFTVTSTAPADLNANGGTYIFLAIA